MNMSPLEQAIQIALHAHQGQTDKAGRPYILHPMSVMLRVNGEQAKIAAILHDVVEDSPTTLDDLRQAGFDENIITIVDALTHRETESYEDYIGRAAQNPIARRIKLADLSENMIVMRYPEIDEEDRTRLNRYLKARAYLLDFTEGQ